jgi:hypothetical protein
MEKFDVIKASGARDECSILLKLEVQENLTEQKGALAGVLGFMSSAQWLCGASVSDTTARLA